MNRFGIRGRFLLLLVGLTLLIFIAITLLIVRQNSATLKTNLINESKSFSSLATQPIGVAYTTYNSSGTLRITQEIDSFTSLDQDINQVEVISADGKVVYLNNSNENKIPVSSAVATNINPTYLYNSSGELSAIVQPYVDSYGIHSYDVVYGVSYNSVNTAIGKIVRSILLLSAVILVFAVVIWYFFINKFLLKPVAEVSHKALSISQGNLDTRISLGRNDEIGDLAKAVDTMASSLKEDIAKLEAIDKLKTEFLMITAHSLRTPITIIEGALDNIKTSKEADDGLAVEIEQVSSNVSRLKSFAEDALAISSMEGGKQRSVDLEPMSMSEVLTPISKEFTSLAAQKKIKLTTNINTASFAKVDKPYFHTAIWNLLDNAYKFTNEGGEIGLTAHDRAGNIEISVSDNGIGISEEEIPHLFTKFHRGTSTLQYNYEGTGIGLYLCKLIVDQHGGSIGVVSNKGKGSTFTIKLPIVSKEQVKSV
ncbi:MAG TPA: HAMP domain-containing sensor histidine kinase [Candidatus Sulfotelmatobacter sp.]|nr:HAMP domain-containing sensor histidine kinase [Candidatus Sulfotelmatobacter sp.]